MTERVLEAITFQLEDFVTEEAFLEAAGAANEFLQSCDGFIARRLAKGDDGVWQEHVEWESKEAAERAFKEASTLPSMEAFFSAARKDSINMAFRQLMLSLN